MHAWGRPKEQQMSRLFRFSNALAAGREKRPAPPSREEILVRLLRQRETAHRLGMAEQERMLRNQITWALPMYQPTE